MIKKELIKSYAKINLSLDVLGRYKNNLHKIQSIISYINLHDKISIKSIKKPNHIIKFNGPFSKNLKNNTISKLLNILEKKNLIKKKYKIEIRKNIPQKSGLGGGSMNAANILKYFLKKKLIKVNKNQIYEIAQEIGSDVILGLASTNCILTSKNELKSFRNCKRLYTLIVKPNFGCSTKMIYSCVKKFNKVKITKPSRKMFNLDFLKKMSNSLEEVALNKYNSLKKIKSYLNNLENPILVRMTGSGSALVSYYYSKKQCDRAQKRFNKDYKKYWCISSKTI